MIQDREKYPLPAWHADTELRAADLLGLEAYLLSRSQIADDDAIGIDRLPDWKESIRFRRNSATKATVTIRDLRGVTPGGQAIWLDRDDELEMDAVSIPPGSLFDAWISVNNDKPGAPKLTLDITAAAEDSKVDETISADNLYLGQYRLPNLEESDEDLKVERHPVCRRLCAFGPVTDPGWARWVAPLRARILSLTASFSGQSNRNAASTALGAELLRLTYEWPVLPIPQLARRLRMVAWLMSMEDGGTEPDIQSAADPIDWEMRGEELPGVLAGLLPQLQEKPTTGLADSLPVLLNLLSSGPVNFHAPIALLKQWNDELAEAKKAGYSESGKRALTGCIESALTANDWSKAVALITAMNLNLRLSNPDAAGSAATVLDQLFKVVRDAPKDRLAAGPMAFYWLARAACLQEGFAQRRFPLAAGYFSRMTGKGAPHGSSDRLVQYLERVTKGPAGTKEVTPFTWWKKMDPRESPSSLRITLAGSRASGKSWLARRLMAESGSRSQTAYPETGGRETRGLLASRGRTMDVSILEIDSSTDGFERLLRGSSTDPVVASLVESQLLVLCIAPGETDEWRSDALKDLALWMRKRRAGVVIAIAYTIADDYGVVDQDGLRFIATKSQGDQLAKMQSAKDPKREWDFFVQGRKETTINAGKTGGIDWTGKKTATGESSPTKQHILENTAPLWRALVSGEDTRGDLLLNGYFIAADSRDPFLEGDSHCGVTHLLADFLACLRGGS